MPQFNLYHFDTNFSEYIQDDNLYIDKSEASLSVYENEIKPPSIPKNDESLDKYENFLRGLALSGPWSKGGIRHLVPRMLSDWNSKNRKE